MEDFYAVEDSNGGVAYGSGKTEIDGQTVNFHFQCYGAIVDINIDGTKYPQIFGGPGEWKYSFPGAYSKGGEGEPSEQERMVPENILTKMADKIEWIFRAPIEAPDPVDQIATNIDSGLDDIDEFDDSFEIAFSHIKDGRKIRMPEGSKPSEFIKKLPTKHEAPEPPLPKGLYRDPPAKRERWGDEDPREDEPRF